MMGSWSKCLIVVLLTDEALSFSEVVICAYRVPFFMCLKFDLN